MPQNQLSSLVLLGLRPPATRELERGEGEKKPFKGGWE